ncbi:MAG: TerC family protein, partial [Lautropia sp.]
FWLALAEIVWVNILLSGDNAVVIALAARTLPPAQQRRAIVIGSAAAIAMRIALTLVAAQMLTLPWLKLVGAVLLIYIGVSLLVQDTEEDAPGAALGGLLTAIRTILIADLVMSLDNVIAVAAAAKDNTVLLITGLAISIPLVIFGSTLLLKVIERFPVLVWLGAALLGFIAGELLVDDPALTVGVGNFEATIHLSHHNFALVCGVAGAALVVLVGRLTALRHQNRTEAA